MTDFWTDLPGISVQLEVVRDRMKSVIRADRFPLSGTVEKLIDANGKMLRPAFMFMAASFGRRPKDISNLAAAIELLHIATLIHDDVIDDADTRRGVPTVHAVHGVKEAVLSGDWLFSRCFRLAADSSSPGNATLLAALVGAICSEEIHQDLERFAWPRSRRNYLRKIAGKTAAMFSLALRAGAIETKASPSVTATLTRVGYDVGIAFQIMDDLLDYESNRCTMRKPVAKDIREGLCTLPLILALRSDEAGIAPLLGSVRPDDCTVDRIVDRVRDSGALEASKLVAAGYTQRAQKELLRLPKGKARDDLEKTVDRLLSRDC
jgi:heptaprenyl diphosphate synthase